MGKAQIAALLATEEQMVTAKFMDVQMQCGGSDCGLFSISFATALVFGEQPGHFLFDHKKMRSHLMHCFEQKQISIRKRRCIHSKVNLLSVPHTGTAGHKNGLMFALLPLRYMR